MLRNKGALFGQRYRIIISTDIGGSDPDDFQSLVHYLLYSDLFDTEGILSSAWGDGTVEDILKVIDIYEKDYPKLFRYHNNYPTPTYLRSITKQGERKFAPYKGYRKATEGSNHIIQCAKKKDSRPHYILCWGLLEDVAQAPHVAPEIKSKIRVYFIGGPNKKWGLNAYQYILKEHPDIWIIENNSTYRGWFNGGKTEKDLSNQTFVSEHIKHHGALGDFFASQLGGVIKMGDTPSVAWLLNGNPEEPQKDSWGGRFVQVYHRPTQTFTRNTTLQDTVERFEVMELIFSGPILEPNQIDDHVYFYLVIDQQKFEGFYIGEGKYGVRFMAKSIGAWQYRLESSLEELNDQQGQFVSVEEKDQTRFQTQQHLTNWWSDDLDPDVAEKEYKGAKTINQYRENYLKDFARRLDRLL